MDRKISRREFVEACATASLAVPMAAVGFGEASPADEKVVRFGIVGAWGRGTGQASASRPRSLAPARPGPSLAPPISPGSNGASVSPM